MHGFGDKTKLIDHDSDFKGITRTMPKFIDKITPLIKAIIGDRNSIKLIIRPQGFGKSFSLKMLQKFFDITENNRQLFETLSIWSKLSYNEKSHQGQYPVLLVNFKFITSDNFSEVEKRFKKMVSDLYHQYKDILVTDALNARHRLAYQEILENKHLSSDKAIAVLGQLIIYLHNHYKKRVILLIDEYDAPILASNMDDKLIDFFKDIFLQLLKDNTYLHMAVVMGTMRIPKGGIFSGLHLSVSSSILDSVFYDRYGNCFGFKESDLQTLLGPYSNPLLLNQLSQCHGGYVSGCEQQLFNPRSIIHFLELNFPDALIDREQDAKNSLANSDASSHEAKLAGLQFRQNFPKYPLKKSVTIQEKLQLLVSGISIIEKLNANTTYSDVKTDYSDESFWSYLVLNGYLAAQAIKDDPQKYQLTIPNRELLELHTTMLKEFEQDDKNNFTQSLPNSLKTSPALDAKETLKDVTPKEVTSTSSILKRIPQDRQLEVADSQNQKVTHLNSKTIPLIQKSKKTKLIPWIPSGPHSPGHNIHARENYARRKF